MNTARRMHSFLIVLTIVLLASCATPQPAGNYAAPRSPQQSKTGNAVKAVAFMRFWNREDNHDDNFCTIDVPQVPFYLRLNLKDEPEGQVDCANDKARSVTLENMPPGTLLWLFDDPDCGKSDDWTKVTVLKQVSAINIPSFGTDFNWDTAIVEADYQNGLTGQLSCFILQVPGPNGTYAQQVNGGHGTSLTSPHGIDVK